MGEHSKLTEKQVQKTCGLTFCKCKRLEGHQVGRQERKPVRGPRGSEGERKRRAHGTFLPVQWLRLCSSTIVGLIPDEGSLMLHSKATKKEGPRMQP